MVSWVHCQDLGVPQLSFSGGQLRTHIVIKFLLNRLIKYGNFQHSGFTKEVKIHPVPHNHATFEDGISAVLIYCLLIPFR